MLGDKAEGMNVHLNGWQRIGIILTIIWAIIGFSWANQIAIDTLGAGVRAAHTRCLDELSAQPDGREPTDADWGRCNRAFARDWTPAVAYHWRYAAAFALVPIPFAWLIGYGLVALRRWIKARG
jgi:hypothetical protein